MVGRNYVLPSGNIGASLVSFSQRFGLVSQFLQKCGIDVELVRFEGIPIFWSLLIKSEWHAAYYDMATDALESV